MDAAEMEDVLKNLDRRTERIEQILPTILAGDATEPGGDHLRALVEDLGAHIRMLAEGVIALDRRDANQHGGLKGELAHVIRRIARLEAAPRTRHAR